MVLEMHCAYSAGNANAALKISCSMCSCNDFLVFEELKHSLCFIAVSIRYLKYFWNVT